MKRQVLIQIRTPGKINPLLRVLFRRSDGFHELQMAFAAISLYDTLSVELREAGGLNLEVVGTPPTSAPADNLVYRAAAAIENAIGAPLHAHLRLEKCIPHGAGLGGGSGNAAGTLLALNRLLGDVLDGSQLRALALQLGSDVPFFLDPRPCTATGRGEILQPLENFPVLHLLVIQPDFSISTAEAFGLVQPSGGGQSWPTMESVAGITAALQNDFEGPLFDHYPQLADGRGRLLRSGASGALLSGTGSALFGIFADAASRDSAAGFFHDSAGWAVWACETLADHAYPNLED